MTIRAFCALLLVALMAAAPLRAQVSGDQYSAADLEKLVAPVALYPDTLLTHVLTASTEPTQVQQAYQLTQSGGQAPSDFSPAVSALMQFPDVLAMMVQNVDWTNALGYAVSVQPDDVMQAVQQVRSRALAAGTLQSSSQLTVQNDGGTVIIASPTDTVYVPVYDVNTLYTPGSALLSFGAGVAVSSLYWSGACDWYRGFYYGPAGAYRGWYYGRPLPAGGAVWGPRPSAYAGRVYNRPVVNNVNVNRINVNNARVGNNNVRVGNNNVRVNNNNVRNTNISKPAVTAPQYNQSSNFRYERGVDSRASSARGRQSMGGGGRRGGRR